MLRNDNRPNQGGGFFGGDLQPAGDDYLLYEAAEAFGLPVSGSALSPGEPNVSAASPLVSRTGETFNADGSVASLVFNGAISQLNLGAGDASPTLGAGVSITDVNGDPIPVIDIVPVVNGLGTDTLTLSYTGSGVVGGKLPAGSYRLNLVGNAITSDGRAVDVANDGSQIDSFDTITFTVVESAVNGDFNDDGLWD